MKFFIPFYNFSENASLCIHSPKKKFMILTSTQKDLLRYAYNETGLIESDRIQRSIDGDPVVRQDFSELVSVLEQLDLASPQPSDESIRKILMHC